MTLFLLSVAVVLIVSALCSLSEAALYAVRLPFVRRLSASGSRAGAILTHFKQNMELPIAAILIINTTANTAGAAVAGAQARLLFGEASLLWFSLFFTLGVLFLSEIIPKVAGVVYARPVAKVIASPWAVTIKLLSPLIWTTQRVAKLFKPSVSVIAPEEEVHHFALLSAEEGSIMQHEAKMVGNVLQLDRLRASELMTPRPVVFKLSSDTTLGEIADTVPDWTYSRVPVYETGDPESWIGFVLARDVLAALAADQFEMTVAELSKTMFFVGETTPGHVLLRSFLKHRTHLFGVVNDYGDITGIVSLEDVLESLIGEEIIDESDVAVDMREVARRRRKELFERLDAEQPGTNEPDAGEDSAP
jgi:CBS domain containing-hemolysin-like protein